MSRAAAIKAKQELEALRQAQTEHLVRILGEPAYYAYEVAAVLLALGAGQSAEGLEFCAGEVEVGRVALGELAARGGAQGGDPVSFFSFGPDEYAQLESSRRRYEQDKAQLNADGEREGGGSAWKRRLLANQRLCGREGSCVGAARTYTDVLEAAAKARAHEAEVKAAELKKAELAAVERKRAEALKKMEALKKLREEEEDEEDA
jgi:hypothetical protein